MNFVLRIAVVDAIFQWIRKFWCIPTHSHSVYAHCLSLAETLLSCSSCSRCRFSQTPNHTVVTDLLQTTLLVDHRPHADRKYLPMYIWAKRSVASRASQTVLASFSEIWHVHVTGWWQYRCLTITSCLVSGRGALLLPWANTRSAGVLGCFVNLPRPAVSPTLWGYISD